MEGWVRLSADLRDIQGKLRESFEREQSPGGTLDDAGLWTVLKGAEEEYGLELEPLVTQLTEKQNATGTKLQLSYVQFVDVVKQYVNKKTKEGWGKREKGGEKVLEFQSETVQSSSQLQPNASEGSASSSDLKPAPAFPLSQVKSTNFTSRQRSISPSHPPSFPKTADNILSDWQSHIEEIQALFHSQGPMKTLEAISSQIGLKWSQESATQFQEMMGRRSDDCGEQGDVFGVVFWPAVEEWIRAHPGIYAKSGLNPTEQLAARLKTTIEEVEKIEKVQALAGQDSSQSQQLLSTLRSQLRKIEAKAVQQGEEPVFMQRCKAGIHEVYTFYAKQTKIMGAKPTFDDVFHSISVLSSGKYLKFLIDFQLLENSKISTRKVIDQSTAMSIFRQTALFHKDMNEAQFTMSLDLVAAAYYDEEFDRLNRTNMARLTMAEKRERLYKSLGFDQEAKYREKLKGYGVPLSSYPDYKISEDDPTRRYKYKVSKEQRETMERWRDRMAEAPNSTVLHAATHPKAKKTAIRSKQASMGDLLDLDSSDFDLNDLVKSSESSPTAMQPLAKSTTSLFQPSKPGKSSTTRAEALMKSSLNQENEAMARALKAANAQMEKGQRVAMRVGAAASKYKA